MADAAEPLVQIIEAGNEHPLSLYADDDTAHLILWILDNRVWFPSKANYQVVIDVGEGDVKGTVRFNLRKKMKKAA